MPSESFRKTCIVFMLGLLTVSAFFMRLNNFKSNDLRTIDEIVYHRMAKQVLEEGPSGYHTIPYGKELHATGRPLPEYFFQPLFKHPPLFTFLIALSMKLFGTELISAEYVSLLLSVLMIPLIYGLASQIYNRRIGILSAFFLWFDPINIICSQKVWMDTTIAFFTLLAAYLFMVGLKRGHDWFFLLSGLASGLAVNTKYTGIFITFIIAVYSVFYRRDLFANKKFQLSLILPLIVLVPWFYWNYKVYGVSSVLTHSELNSIYMKLIAYIPIIVFLGVLILLFIFVLNRRKKSLLHEHHLHEDANLSKSPLRYLSAMIPIAFFVLIVPKQFLHSLQITYLPTHSWQQGIFFGEPPSFYFGRLLEFSPLYILSFTAILLFNPDEKKETPLIRLAAIVILLFFIVWGNFQSRYILSSLPFLIILGVVFAMNIYDQLCASQNTPLAFTGRICLKLIFAFILMKTYYLNIMVSYPNNMCYF